MASETVTLALDGSPTLNDLSTALNGLLDLLQAIEAELALKSDISWAVDDLSTGSADSTFRGRALRRDHVTAVSARYLSIGRSLHRGEPLGSPRIASATERIVGVLNGRVPSLRFETADDEVLITAARGDFPAPDEPRGAYGGILGRIQTLSNRRSHRHPRPVLPHPGSADWPAQCRRRPSTSPRHPRSLRVPTRDHQRA